VRQQLWRIFVLLLRRTFVIDNISTLAAAISFYALLSFVPFLLLAASVMGFFLASSDQALHDIVNFVSGNFPGAATGALKLFSETVQNKTLYGLLGLIGMLWGSTRVFAVLEEAMSRIWRTRGRRSFWKSRLVAYVCVPIMMLFVTVSLTLTTILQALKDNQLPLLQISIIDIPVLGTIVSYGVPLLISVMLFTWIYYLLPSRWHHLKSAFIGALLAGVLWELAKLVFDYYVRNFGGGFSIYGSFTSLALLFLWVYYSATVVLLGAEFGSMIQLVKERRHQ